MVDIATPSQAPAVWVGMALRGLAGGAAAYMVTGLTLWVPVSAAGLLLVPVLLDAARLAYGQRSQEETHE